MCMLYAPLDVLSNVEIFTVAGLASSPLYITAHTGAAELYSLTVYDSDLNPIVTPEGKD